VLGIGLIMVALYDLRVWRVNQQARRFKTKFAKRMADTFDLRATMLQLPLEALASEFKKIDSKTQDGHISKEALWNFLSDGKVGDLSESDFNSLFAAIDLDQNGTVDFLELCTFMGKYSDEYCSAGGNHGSVVDRASRRISMTDVTARMAPGTDDDLKAVADDVAKMVALEEGETDNIDE
jgi:hypothetical protein